MKDKGPKKSSLWKWPRYVSGCLLVLLVPWCLILTYHPRFALKASESAVVTTDGASIKTDNTDSVIKIVPEPKVTIVKVVPETKVAPEAKVATVRVDPETKIATVKVDSEPKVTPKAKKNHHLDNVVVYGSDRFTVDGDSKMIKSATPPSKTVTWDLHKDAPLLGPMPTKGIINNISIVCLNWKHLIANQNRIDLLSSSRFHDNLDIFRLSICRL